MNTKYSSILVSRFITTCLIISALAAPAHADDPEKFYRDFWTSVDLSNLEGLAAYYSEDLLGEMKEALEEIGEEEFKRITAEQNELIKAATIFSLKVNTVDDKASLVVIFNLGEIGRKKGIPSLKAEIELIRTAAGWRISQEEFSADESRVLTTGGVTDCPPGYALGDPQAPNSIVFRKADGDRTVHFDDVWLILERGFFTLEIPHFHLNQWDIKSLDLTHDAEQKIWISGMSAGRGENCLSIPKEMGELSDIEGRIVFKGELPFLGSETFAASFEFHAADAPAVSIIGEITSGKVLSINPSVLEDNGQVRHGRDGELMQVKSVMASHSLHDKTLTVDYQIEHGGGNFLIMEYNGEPGVHTHTPLSPSRVDDEWVQMVDIAIIDIIEDGIIVIESREAMATEVPEGELTPETARSLGILMRKVRTNHIFVKPERSHIK